MKADEPALVDCHQSMTWVERRKRVFNIDITICSRCGDALRIIAFIEDPSTINKIFLVGLPISVASAAGIDYENRERMIGAAQGRGR